jgi:hypothetical protein
MKTPSITQRQAATLFSQVQLGTLRRADAALVHAGFPARFIEEARAMQATLDKALDTGSERQAAKVHDDALAHVADAEAKLERLTAPTA